MWAGHIKASIASLRASRWRTNLTMLGIIIGISSVVTVVSLGEGLKQQVVGQISRLGPDVITIRPGKLVSGQGEASRLNLLALLSTSTLTDDDVASLKKLGSAQTVLPINFVTSSASSSEAELNNISVIGTGPQIPQMLGLSTNLGEFFSEDSANEKIAIIGQDTANKLYGELNPIGHSINIAGQDFIVRGILAPSSTGLLVAAQTDFNSAVLIPYEPSKTVVGGKTNLLQILLQASSGASSDQVIKQAREVLLKTHEGNEDFTILKQHQLLNLVNGVINSATRFITSIAAISLLVGGIGIMDIMLAGVSERTREIGIRKAVGATNRQILVQFFSEGLVLSLLGGLLGILVAMLINLILRLYTSLHPVVDVPVIILAVGISVIIGVIFSTAPALKAARKHPIDALRA